MNKNAKTISGGSHDIERRRFLRNSAVVAGAAMVVPTMSIAKTTKPENNIAHGLKDDDVQQQFIVDVLNKYAAKSKRVDRAHIHAFARGFIEQNGQQDYQRIFKGMRGEYKLVKLFMKSMNASRL